MTRKLAIAVITALALAGCGGSAQHPQTHTLASVNDPLTAAASAPRTASAPRKHVAISTAPTTTTTPARRVVRHHPTNPSAPDPTTTTATTTTATTTSTAAPRHVTTTKRTPPTRTTSRSRTTASRPTRTTAKPTGTKPSATQPTTVLPGTMTTSATTTNAGLPSGTNVQGPTPIECMQQRQLINPHAMQLEEWEGVDPLTHKPIFVIGPFQSPGLAQQYVQTYQGINLDAAGGLYVASAALTSNLNFQVNALAKCLMTAIGQGTLS